MQLTKALLTPLTLCLVTGCAPAVRGEEAPSEVVHFEIVYETSLGTSVFLLGDIEELGAGAVPGSLKLAPTWDGQSLRWTADIDIPQGRTFTYRYLLRDDSLGAWSDPDNGVQIGEPEAGATRDPEPATRSLTVFALAAEDPRDIIFETPDGPVAQPFLPAPGRPDLVYAMLPEQPNGRGIEATLLGEAIDTPLHTVLRRYGPLYNYDPEPAALPVSRVYEHVLETDTVPATRTVDNVTGRGFQVYVPRGYEVETDRRYPVLYMHDGQNCFFEGGPFGSWRAEEVADRALNAAEVREFIIVAVDNSEYRVYEYVPEWSNYIVNNDDYNHFLVDELKPWVDSHYRTLTGPQDTGVIGSSLGGIASLVLGLDYSDTFGLVGAMSPSLWAGSTAARVETGELPASVRLYMDAGDTDDGGDAAVALRDALMLGGRVLGDDFWFQIGFGHQHNEVAWNARLPDFLRFQFPITEEENALEALIGCAGDLDGDGETGQSDLGLLLTAYEQGAGGDVDGDGDTDQSDLGLLLAAFGCVDPV
ncbi:MAG: alpha/beta hydrolase-fold protein [Phycisphaerales bacterium JB038]